MIPDTIGQAKVLYYTTIDDRHMPTGNTKHWVGGQLMKPFNGLAICKYEDTGGFYLFYCDKEWNVINDGWNETIEDAKNQAEFEYNGVSKTWIKKE